MPPVDFVLRALGAKTVLFSQTGAVGRGEISLELGGHDDLRVRLGGGDPFLLKEIGAFWNRWDQRSVHIPPFVHPADEQYVRTSILLAVDGLRALLRDTFAVNRAEGARILSSKINQLRVARHVGLAVPETIVSSNYDDVCAFAAKHSRLCVKPFFPFVWQTDAGPRVANAALLSQAELVPEQVRLTPHIYQEFISKHFEVRVTAFGNYVAATAIPQTGSVDAVDWRANASYLAHLEPISVPDDVRAQIRHLMRRLSLRFGCLDFVVRPDGKWVFLEINETAQFLWQEDFCPECAILEPFARFLISRSEDFTWDPVQRSAELAAAAVETRVKNDPSYDALREEPPLRSRDFGIYDERAEVS